MIANPMNEALNKAGIGKDDLNPKKDNMSEELKIENWVKNGNFGENNMEADQIISDVENLFEKIQSKDKKGNIRYAISSTKLRQYYDEFCRFYRLKQEKRKLNAYLLLTKMKYDLGRQNKKDKEGFQEFVNLFERLLGKIKWEEDNVEDSLYVFKKWFEALIAVGKAHLSEQ